MTNAFGWMLSPMSSFFEDPALSQLLRNTFSRSLKELGLNAREVDRITEKLFSLSKHFGEEYCETQMQKEFATASMRSLIRKALDRRALRMVEQIKRFLPNGKVYDLGSGDGYVSHLLSREDLSFVLLDVQNYLDERVQHSFVQIRDSHALPLMEKADCTLLLTVLHHSLNPLLLLSEARRLTSGTCIIIESVFGEKSQSQRYPETFRLLAPEQQLRYAMFVDWAYNRLLHDGVQTPFNFTTPSHWRKIFAQQGWQIQQEIDLGIDQPLVPEHHFMFILRPLQ